MLLKIFSAVFKTFLFLNAVKDGESYKISWPCIFGMFVVGILLRVQKGSRLFWAGINSSFFFLIIFAVIYSVCGGLGFGDVIFVGSLAMFYGVELTVLGCIVASLLGLAYFAFEKIVVHSRIERIPLCPFLSVGVLSSEAIWRLGWI